MAQEYVDRAAWRLLERTEGWPRVRALELSCGDGLTLDRAAAAGAEVVGTTYLPMDRDYIRARAYPASIADRVVGGVDLNRPLPPDPRLEAGSFDVVYAVEVIEHVESHHTLIAEASRMLRPGGHLVLTTPNLHRLGNRLRYAATGVHQYKREPIPVGVGPARVSEFHHRCVDLVVLHPLMWMHGLRVVGAEVSKAKPLSRALVPLAALASPLTRRVLTRRAGGGEDAASKRDLARLLNGRAVRTSEQLCLLARKVSERA